MQQRLLRHNSTLAPSPAHSKPCAGLSFYMIDADSKQTSSHQLHLAVRAPAKVLPLLGLRPEGWFVADRFRICVELAAERLSVDSGACRQRAGRCESVQKSRFRSAKQKFMFRSKGHTDYLLVPSSGGEMHRADPGPEEEADRNLDTWLS